MLLPGLRQGPPCQRSVPITLRAAVTDWLITTIASEESSQGRMRLPRMRQAGCRERTLPEPQQAAEEGPAITSASALLWHERSVPLRRLFEASCVRWLLCWTCCTVLLRSAAHPSFSAQDGLRLSWLYEAPFRARLLPGSLATATGEAPACAASGEARVAYGQRLHRPLRTHASER